MDNDQLQIQLFNYLKEILPAHISLVDELCDLLNIGSDSVYRRLRGEKQLNLGELKKICVHYHLSLDHLLELQSDAVLFNVPEMEELPLNFDQYLKNMLKHLKYFNSFSHKEMNYLCKDSTLWNFYLFPEIAAFKTFFWSKTINKDPQLRDQSFSFKEFPFDDCFQTGQQILHEYNLIPSLELWNQESMHSTINQIAYYRDTGNFRSPEDLEMVIQSFQKMISHLQLQAEKGVKFMPGATDVSYKAPIQFYVNELILGNNTMVITLDNQMLTMVTYSVLHYLFTKNAAFSSRVLESFETLLSRSTLVSKSGEKERTRFFNALREKVNTLRI